MLPRWPGDSALVIHYRHDIDNSLQERSTANAVMESHAPRTCRKPLGPTSPRPAPRRVHRLLTLPTSYYTAHVGGAQTTPVFSRAFPLLPDQVVLRVEAEL